MNEGQLMTRTGHGDTEIADSTSAYFATDAAGLPEATTPQVVELQDGDVFDLRAFSVARWIGDARHTHIPSKLRGRKRSLARALERHHGDGEARARTRGRHCASWISDKAGP